MKNNLANDLATLYEEDVQSFIDNLNEFPDNKLWDKPGNVPNSAGVLAQHIAGNLNYYIGSVIGGINYERDRDAEFQKSGKSKKELVKDLETVIDAIHTVFPGLDEQTLKSPLPSKNDKSRTTRKALLQFYRHLNYHLGQLNYLKRVIK